MRFQNISLLGAVLAVVAAQRVEQDDIPWECNDVCADLVSTAKRCDDQNSKILLNNGNFGKQSNSRMQMMTRRNCNASALRRMQALSSLTANFVYATTTGRPRVTARIAMITPVR